MQRRVRSQVEWTDGKWVRTDFDENGAVEWVEPSKALAGWPEKYLPIISNNARQTAVEKPATGDTASRRKDKVIVNSGIAADLPATIRPTCVE